MKQQDKSTMEMSQDGYDTKVLPVTPESIKLAAKLLQEGHVVAIPTETVYGLAANALDEKAVERIFSAKGRPQDNPLIVHVASLPMMKNLVVDIGTEAQKLAAEFWPGPLTIVLSASDMVAKNVCAGLDTVGIRMPNHPAALAIIEQAGIPLAAPSANLSGSPSPTTAQHVYQDMKGRIPLILDGGMCDVGIESTVLSLFPVVKVLRPGYVTPQEIESVLHCPVQVAGAVTAPLAEGQKVESPGMKYRHYAPQAEVTIVRSSLESYISFIDKNKGDGVYALCFTGEGAQLPVPYIEYGEEQKASEQAAALFNALRLLDDKGAVTVYARSSSLQGIGLAVYNRLLRAAGFRVIDI